MLSDTEGNNIAFEAHLLSSEYSERVLALFPEVAALVETNRVLANGLADLEKAFNENSSFKRNIFSHPTGTIARIQETTNLLAYVIDSGQQYDALINEVWETAEKRSQDVIQQLPDELKAEFETGFDEGEAGELLIKRRQLLDAGAACYARFGHEQRAEVLRLIFYPDALTPSDEEIAVALHTIVATSIPNTDDSLTPVEDLINKAKKHEFDHVFLEFGAAAEPETYNTPAVANITRLIMSVAVELGLTTENEKNAFKAIGNLLSIVPSNVRHEIPRIRDKIIRLLTSFQQRNMQFKRPRRLPSLDEFKETLTELVVQHIIELKTQSERYVPEEKTPLPMEVGNISNGGAEEASIKEVMKSKRKVLAARRVLKNFEVRERDSATLLAEMVEEYVTQMAGGNELEADLRTAFDFLASVDRSQGQVDGIKKLRYKFKVEGAAVSVWSLKPKEAGDIISDNSGHMDRTRIVFTWGKNNTVIIFKILYRDKQVEYERSMGVGFGRRG